MKRTSQFRFLSWNCFLCFVFASTAAKLPIVDLDWWYKKTRSESDELESSIPVEGEKLTKLLLLENFLKINFSQTRDFKTRKPPLYMRNLYQNLNQLTATETNVNNFTQQHSTVRIRGVWPAKVINMNDTQHLIFTNLLDLNVDTLIDQAELILRTKKIKGHKWFAQNDTTYKSYNRVLDVTHAVNNWLGRNHNASLPFILKIGSTDWTEFQPLSSHRVFLILYYGINQLELIASVKSSQHNSRHLIRVPRETNSSSDKCRLHEWFVDFEDLGWNSWVLAPSGFQANMCSGECPSILMQPEYQASNHAMLRGLYRASQSDDNAATVNAACCVPTSLRSTNLMYTEGNGIIIRRLDNIIAEQCGCQ